MIHDDINTPQTEYTRLPTSESLEISGEKPSPKSQEKIDKFKEQLSQTLGILLVSTDNPKLAKSYEAEYIKTTRPYSDKCFWDQFRYHGSLWNPLNLLKRGLGWLAYGFCRLFTKIFKIKWWPEKYQTLCLKLRQSQVVPIDLSSQETPEERKNPHVSLAQKKIDSGIDTIHNTPVWTSHHDLSRSPSTLYLDSESPQLGSPCHASSYSQPTSPILTNKSKIQSSLKPSKSHHQFSYSPPTSPALKPSFTSSSRVPKPDTPTLLNTVLQNASLLEVITAVLKRQDLPNYIREILKEYNSTLAIENSVLIHK